MSAGVPAVIVLAHAADVVALGGVALGWAVMTWLRRRRSRGND